MKFVFNGTLDELIETIHLKAKEYNKDIVIYDNEPNILEIGFQRLSHNGGRFFIANVTEESNKVILDGEIKDIFDNQKKSKVGRIWNEFTDYLLAYISFKELYKPSIAHPRYIRAFFMAELVLIVFSSIFIFDFGMNTNILYGRLIRFAQVPSVILMSYLYDSSIISRTLKLAVVIGIINCFYTLSYSLYNTMTV